VREKGESYIILTMPARLRTDFLIVGAGIIGLALAKQLREKFPGKKVIILEKEKDVAMHTSGRNSGVLHAGFYYTSDSLKARFTAVGSREMKKYCRENGLKLNECGKVVVAQNPSDLDTLYELERRGIKNGVNVKIIDESELLEIEPNAKTLQKALYSPDTATVEPTEVCLSLKKDLMRHGVEFNFSEGYLKKTGANAILTEAGRTIEYGKLINCAGLYADKIANDFNFGLKYTILPFKGMYLKYVYEDKPVKMNIYPVPDIKNPFLGVHYTVTVDNAIKIGPTAMPAFWRENYDFSHNFDIKELLPVLTYAGWLFVKNSFGFRDLAFREMLKYSRKHFICLAEKLVRRIDASGFKEWSKPGIRAQLLDKENLELVQDFVVSGDKNSVHILNAVSPAFTSSFPFTRWVVENHV